MDSFEFLPQLLHTSGSFVFPACPGWIYIFTALRKLLHRLHIPFYLTLPCCCPPLVYKGILPLLIYIFLPVQLHHRLGSSAPSLPRLDTLFTFHRNFFTGFLPYPGRCSAHLYIRAVFQFAQAAFWSKATTTLDYAVLITQFAQAGVGNALGHFVAACLGCHVPSSSSARMAVSAMLM